MVLTIWIKKISMSALGLEPKNERFFQLTFTE